MTVEDLMTQTATLRKLNGATRSGTGGSTPQYDDVEIIGYFEPEDPIGLEGENIQERNTQMGRWLGFIPADIDLTGFDVIVFNGKTMDLTAPPRPIGNPRLAVFSHIELSLRIVE